MSDRQQSPSLTTDGPPRALLIAGIAVATAAIAVVLVIAVISRPDRHPDTQPVAIPAVPAPQDRSPECQKLLSVLPARLGDYQRATPTAPPPGAAAWQRDGAGEPAVLRCGVDRPTDFVVGAPIRVINAVQWFEASESGRSTWFAVDRPVYVALTLPQGSGPAPIQQISDMIVQTMPAVPIRPGPPR